MNKKIIKTTIVMMFAMLGAAFTATGQRLPSKQNISVRAPDNIKIDGNLDEWEGRLQANDHINHLFYTVSNDDNKLYLSILIKDQLAIDKLLEGGLTFTISHETTKKREKDTAKATITYPVFADKSRNSLRGNIHVFFSYKDDNNSFKAHLDSLITVENKRADNLLKQIQVTGLVDVKKATLSVDNTEGISASLHFGKGMACAYELAIPLKSLGLSINNPIKFSYNIMLNGQIESIKPGAPPAPFLDDGVGNPDGDFEIAPTDFWGEYILIKR